MCTCLKEEETLCLSLLKDNILVRLLLSSSSGDLAALPHVHNHKHCSGLSGSALKQTERFCIFDRALLCLTST